MQEVIPEWTDRIMKKLTIKNMPKLPYAVEEAVNRLRINMSFLGKNVRNIMVVSSVPNEGKSFVAMQLWRQMAETGTPSILVDADLRKSVMTEVYQIQAVDKKEKLQGTSHYLAGDADISKAVYQTDIECGDILPNIDNVVNPSLLLESSRFEEMLKTMKGMYQYVFVDSPPLDLVSDGERIGSLCDGAILVVRGGVTSKNMVKSSIRQLERAGCPLLGVVLNRVEGSKGGYYYKKYGGGRYYGGKYYRGDKYYYGKHK